MLLQFLVPISMLSTLNQQNLTPNKNSGYIMIVTVIDTSGWDSYDLSLHFIQLIFRDFKTSNILLDEDFNAKLSDFGLARQGPAAGLGHVSTSVSPIS